MTTLFTASCTAGSIAYQRLSQAAASVERGEAIYLVAIEDHGALRAFGAAGEGVYVLARDYAGINLSGEEV